MQLTNLTFATLFMTLSVSTVFADKICGNTVVKQVGKCHNDQDAQVCYDGVDQILCECPTGVRWFLKGRLRVSSSTLTFRYRKPVKLNVDMVTVMERSTIVW